MPFKRASVFAETMVAMVIKVVNSEHERGEERGVMCSYVCTFTNVLLVKQIIACLR